MTTRLMPYGSADHARNVAKVGNAKTPVSVAGRMPSMSNRRLVRRNTKAN